MLQFIRSYPHLSLTLLLAGVLLIPFSFSLISPSFEPYPAVILPSGYTMIRIQEDKFAMVVRRIEAIDASTGAYEAVHARDLLYPVPGHFFRKLSQRTFGLTNHPKSAEAIKWIQNNLTLLGYADSTFRVVTDSIFVDFDPGLPHVKKRLNEQTFTLR